MASLVNKYLHKTKLNEQGVLDGMVRESIQMLGMTYYYIPRDMTVEDLILGEDIVSNFPLAVPIEMYMNAPMGFLGDKEMFSKFGLEIQNSYKLSVHKTRWEQEVKTQFDTLVANGEVSFEIIEQWEVGYFDMEGMVEYAKPPITVANQILD